MGPCSSAPSRRYELAAVLAALGDGKRLLLVSKLCSRGPQSIAHLTFGSKITRQAITKHLCALERAGVVESRRVGRERIWEIRTSRLKQARGYLDQISRQWDDAIERLQLLVEQAAE